MTTTFYATFRYHPTIAPTGIKFTDEATFNALGPEWVDTPTKFPAPAPEPEAVTPEPPKRGRPKKEQA